MPNLKILRIIVGQGLDNYTIYIYLMSFYVSFEEDEAIQRKSRTAENGKPHNIKEN